MKRSAQILIFLLIAQSAWIVGCDDPTPRDGDADVDGGGDEGDADVDGGVDAGRDGDDADAGGDGGDTCPDCTEDQVCVDGLCCRPPTPSGSFLLPAHTSYVHWTFPGAAVSELEFTVEILNDPGTDVGLYLSPINTSVDDTPFYLGLQTNVVQPGVGAAGKAIVFSRWDSLDPADTRAAEAGFIEVGTHEGEFVGVRLPYDWTAGTYQLRLERAEAEGDGDWFDLYVVDVTASEERFAGGLRFPRSVTASPGTIDPFITTFTEVYMGVTDYGLVPMWHVALWATTDGAPATTARSEYPAYPYAEYPNTDVSYDATSSLVHMVYGGDTARCHAAGTLF